MDNKTMHSIKIVLFLQALIFLFLFSDSSYSAEDTWAKYYSVDSQSIKIISIDSAPGGYVLTGYIKTPYSRRLAVIKTDSVGNPQWSKYLSPLGAVGKKVITIDDGFVVLGESGTGNDKSAWLIKLENDGDVEWEKLVDRYYYDIDGSIDDLVVLMNGYLVIANGKATKVDSDGNIVWKKQYNRVPGRVLSAIEMINGEIVIVRLETTRKSISLAAISNTNGNIVWSRYFSLYDGETSNDEWLLRNAKLWHANRSSGEFFVSIQLWKAADLDDSLSWRPSTAVMKLDNSGNVIWKKHYNYRDVNEIRSQDDKYFLIGAYYKSKGNTKQGFLAALHNNADPLWHRYLQHANNSSYIPLSSTINNTSIIAAGILGGGYDNRSFIYKALNNGEMNQCDIMSPPSTIDETSKEFFEFTPSLEISVIDADIAELSNLNPTNNDLELTVYQQCLVSTEIPGSAPAEHCESIFSRRTCNLMRYGEDWTSLARKGFYCPPTCSLSIAFEPTMNDEIINNYIILSDRYNSIPYRMSRQYEKDKKSESFKGSKKLDRYPQPLKDLINTLNQTAIKNAIPKQVITQKSSGKSATLDFDGIAMVTFSNLLKGDNVTMKIVPYKHELPRNHSKIWPAYHYDFDFRGSLSQNGFIDIHFYYGGLDIMAGEKNNIRIIQWDEKGTRDITTYVDTKRKIISGRTNKLTTFSIVRRDDRQ